MLRGGRAVATTVPAVRIGSSRLGGLRGRGRASTAAAASSAPPGREELVVFTDASELNDAISREPAARDRRCCSRSCCWRWPARCSCRARFRQQIGKFLEAARRLAGGRFDEPVPVDRQRRVRAARPRVQPHVGAARGQDRRGASASAASWRRRSAGWARRPPAGSTARGSSSWPCRTRSRPARPRCGRGAPARRHDARRGRRPGTPDAEPRRGARGRGAAAPRESQNTADREVPRTASSAKGVHGIAICR